MGCEKLKFSQQNSSFNNIFSNSNLSCLLPPEMQSPNWNNSLKTLSVQALSSNTWHKYFASLTKFQTYLADTKQTLNWPVKAKQYSEARRIQQIPAPEVLGKLPKKCKSA
jgi:hypothetical protein